MKWDIFGKKKKAEYESKWLTDINEFLIKQSEDIEKLSIKFDKLIEELQNIQEMAKIPLVSPKIRNAEDVYNEEKRAEQEFTNLFKN